MLKLFLIILSFPTAILAIHPGTTQISLYEICNTNSVWFDRGNCLLRTQGQNRRSACDSRISMNQCLMTQRILSQVIRGNQINALKFRLNEAGVFNNPRHYGIKNYYINSRNNNFSTLRSNSVGQ